MTHTILNISRTLAVCIAILVPTMGAHAQLLNAYKPGTIKEQIENSNLRSSQTSRVQEILDYAQSFRGVPYRYGKMSPSGFDCSGFTSYVFKRFGINLHRTSRAQINNGERVSRDELQPGDLVFFNGRRASGRRIGHVGIVLQVNDDNTFKFIHAATRTGITVSNSTESYYRKRYVGACRVID